MHQTHFCKKGDIFLHFADRSVRIRMLLNFRGGLLMDKKTTGIVSGKSPENPVRDLTPVRAASGNRSSSP